METAQRETEPVVPTAQDQHVIRKEPTVGPVGSLHHAGAPMTEPEPGPRTENQKLRDQFQEIATLAGGLAHEIKNPLSTIRLNLELLAEDLTDGDSPRERRATAKIMSLQKECQRLQDVLDDFLRFVKVQNLKTEPADLNQLLERTLEFYRPQAVDAGIELVRYLDPDLPLLALDAEKLHGALLNLILNAQQAMPGGGQIVLRTQRQGDWVVLDLIDTGCGMDERVQQQIFDVFYSTRPGGSGLGLPTARRIIEAHGGYITLQSAVGRGTQFSIHLPVSAGPDA
jgi:two-component system sensor histidine kinase HydH